MLQAGSNSFGEGAEGEMLPYSGTFWYTAALHPLSR